MREILFRGKRLDNGEWIEGHYGERFDGEGIVACISRPSKETISGSLCYDVDPSTVGQYTGRPDKNWKKIFYGDILQFGGRRIVVWPNEENSQWQVDVIGNVYDNDGLLC